jgi:hypothetical protein
MKLSLAPQCTPGTGELQVRLWVDGDSAATTQVLTWFITVDTANACLTSAINDVATSSGIKVYPNPATSTVEIDLNRLEQNTSISLFDISGRLVYQLKEAAVTNVIPLQCLSAGTYLLKVLSPSGVITKKFEKGN